MTDVTNPEDLMCPCMSCQMERSAKGIAEPSVGERLDALNQCVSANKTLSQLFAEALESIEAQKSKLEWDNNANAWRDKTTGAWDYTKPKPPFVQPLEAERMRNAPKTSEGWDANGSPNFSYDFARRAGKSFGDVDLLSTHALFAELKKRIGSNTRDQERLQMDLRALELDLEELNK